jgi:dienelactone hydrolase
VINRAGYVGLVGALIAVPITASAAAIQTGSAGGLQYQYLVGPGGCSAANPCQVVEYLHYLGGESQVPADLNSYFNTDAFWSAHPNTIVVAPQVNGSADDNNWGGVQSGVSSNGQAAVSAVRQIEAQYPTNPNTVVLTGGSMGGIGTEALMEEFGPKGTTGDHVYAAGLAYDGAVYNSSPASQKSALCGVPLVVQHGTADSTVNPGPDNALAQTLSGCPGFQYVQVPGAGHGTWGSGYTDGSQLSQVMGAAAGASSVQAAVSQPAAASSAVRAPERVSPLPTSSQSTAYITVGEGTFRDAAGNTYSVRSDGAALMNGQPTPGGYGTQAMAYENGVVWGQDAHTNVWWQFSTSENGWTPTDTAPDGVPVQTPAPLHGAADPVPAAFQPLPILPLAEPPPVTGSSTTPPSAGSCKIPGGKGFSVSDGRIIDPQGQTFVPQGVSVVDGTLPQVIDGSGNPLLSKFPQINMVRIGAWGGYNQNDQGIINAVKVLTEKGIVVQINNYNGPNAIDPGDVSQEVEWVKAWAARYKDNPLVWFGSKNEPQNGAGTISSEHKAFYDAVRSTGNLSMISFDLVGGSGTNDLDGSVYATMRNVSIDAHFYDWISGYSTDFVANQNALADEVSAAQSLGHSADGVIPVFIGEWGNSTDGSNIDIGWVTVVNLVLSSGFGQVAWVFFAPGSSGDELTQGGGDLTEFGQMVAAGIAKNATRRPVGCGGVQ